MNFSEVAEVLHISREGSRKRILKYKDDPELQEYLIYDNNNKIIGLKEDGIDILRNLGASRRSFAEERNLNQYKTELALKTQENNFLRQIINNKDQELLRFEKIFDESNKRITQLEAEIKQLKGMSFWQRLTYRK